MEKVLFKDLFLFEKKSTIKAGGGLLLGEGKYPFYTSSNTLTKSIDNFQFDRESLIFGTGGMASIHICSVPFAVSTDCFVTQAYDLKKVFTKYVFYYLSGNIHLLENGFKGAGLKHISKDYLQKIEIPLPSLSEQKAIAQKLDKAQEIIHYNEKIIAQYDALTQSLFLDMFGSNSPNYIFWEETKIEDIALKAKGSMRTGPFGSDLLHSEFVDNGIAVLGIDNAVNNKFEWNQRRFITEEKYSKLQRYRVYPSDIIITIMGTIGRVAVVPENIGIAINTKHLAAITLNQKIVNPEFIAYTLYSDKNVLSQIRQNGKGAIMTGLNLSIIRSLRFKLPPIELQNQFAERVKAIERQKQLTQESLDQSKALFNSLLQQSFKN